jgi:hypothetical protein
MPVKAGYRVTLTYNLYFGAAHGGHQNGSDEKCMVSARELAFRQALQDLLPNPNFLYGGGFMGFGLQHQYPLDIRAKSFAHLLDCLKGSDAIVKKVCETLSLTCTLQAIYADEECEVMIEHPVDFLSYGECENGIEEVLREKGGTVVSASGDYQNQYVYENAIGDIWWITPGGMKTSLNKIKTVYVAYGNEPSLEYTYGNLVLIVEVGPVNQRTVL